MPKGKHVPTVASGRLAAELRALREEAKLTHEVAAEELGWSPSKMYRIENDKSRVLVRDIKRLLRLYQIDDDRADAILELGRLAPQEDWWHQYSSAIPEWFQVYLTLEATASHIQGYESEQVPGLLQTEAYARAIFSTAPQPASEDETDDHIKVRMSRQSRLTGDDPPDLWIVLNEAVIRRAVGGPDVMREQLRHLAEMSRRRNVTLQVLPFDAGAHGAMLGTFKLLRFPRPEPDRVYLEQQIGGLYTQKPHEVERYRLTFDHLRAQALGPAQTLTLFAKAADDLG